MPREQQSRREVLAAINALPSLADLTATHDGHFDHELDLEVIVYGRNYNGKKVGPYVRLLTYDPDEIIIREGDWGGNTFYVVVEGRPQVFLQRPDGSQALVSDVPPGRQFGEMSVLAGVPRSATVKAPPGKAVRVLEVQRPALRLLRKLSKFGEGLEAAYQHHGRNSAYQEMKIPVALGVKMLALGDKISRFKVFARNHVLFQQGAPVEWLYVIKEGWLRRSRDGARREFLGNGYCFGLEGARHDACWPETVTLLGRTEVLMISVAELRRWPALQDALLKELARFAAPAAAAEPNPQVAAAQEKLIDTGLVDGTNLLVMDMDLCVRCGRCSMACHQIHGHSRLLRRGIHVTRLEGRGTQEALAPAVCLHCQDPECLTGCPTGAIGRFSLGQIDINPKTCIGCGDCATNCPYNAISMVARKPPPAPPAAQKWRQWLRLTPDPLPPRVEQADDLLAVKCNLCSGTPLNPPGSRTTAYGCEENCPTGALARVNPREYFSEIGRLEGLAFRDQTHAVGRNIHRIDPPKRRLHLAGALLTLLLTAAAALGLRRYGFGAPVVGWLNLRWLTGLVGLVGIAAVMTYPARRQIFRRRAGPLRYWMLAHSYLGVIAGVMLLLHGGAHPGGALTTALMLAFDLVILTGLFGLACYWAVPRLLTQIEGDPLLIDDLKMRRGELQRELTELVGAATEEARRATTERVAPRFVSLGFGLRQYARRETLDALLAAAREEFAPVLAALPEAEARRQLTRIIEAIVTLRRVEALIVLHQLLRAWLPPHVVATSLMLALLVVHLIQVLYAMR